MDVVLSKLQLSPTPSTNQDDPLLLEQLHEEITETYISVTHRRFIHVKRLSRQTKTANSSSVRVEEVPHTTPTAMAEKAGQNQPHPSQ